MDRGKCSCLFHLHKWHCFHNRYLHNHQCSLHSLPLQIRLHRHTCKRKHNNSSNKQTNKKPITYDVLNVHVPNFFWGGQYSTNLRKFQTGRFQQKKAGEWGPKSTQERNGWAKLVQTSKGILLWRKKHLDSPSWPLNWRSDGQGVFLGSISAILLFLL